MVGQHAILNMQYDAACKSSEAAELSSWWAVILKLVPVRDGDQWCVLWGDNIMEGIVAFASTPRDSMYAFQFAMNEKCKVLQQPMAPLHPTMERFDKIIQAIKDKP